MNDRFWNFLDEMIKSHPLIIDRKKGSNHPNYSLLIYPLDYGYLEGTRSMDHGGIDVWVGSQNPLTVNGIFCTIDTNKNDSEIKIVIGCNDDEIRKISDFHNDYLQAAIWVPKLQ